MNPLSSAEADARIESAIDALWTWTESPRSAAKDAAFAEWIMDTDTPTYARRYLATVDKSNCGLVVRKFLRLVGVLDKEIVQPYARRDGLVIADIGTIARRYHAWRSSPADLSVYPARGDVLCIRRDKPGTEHVCIVLGARAEDGAVKSLDGGQAMPGVPGGGSVVGVRYRVLIAPETGAPYVRDCAQPELLVAGGLTRTIYGRVDTRALLAEAA